MKKKIKLSVELLDTESAVQAIETVSALAEADGIKWALCGGLALIMHGSDRLTKDLDFIANRRLPIQPEKIVAYLAQGGEHFLIETEKQIVSVDWILRNDEAKILFQQALSDAVEKDGVPVVTPEWLVIMKHIAGRGKDQLDALYLLSQPNLVDRRKIKRLIVETAGSAAWVGFKSGLERWYDLADGAIHRTPDGLRDS